MYPRRTISVLGVLGTVYRPATGNAKHLIQLLERRGHGGVSVTNCMVTCIRVAGWCTSFFDDLDDVTSSRFLQ